MKLWKILALVGIALLATLCVVAIAAGWIQLPVPERVAATTPPTQDVAVLVEQIVQQTMTAQTPEAPEPTALPTMEPTLVPTPEPTQVAIEEPPNFGGSPPNSEQPTNLEGWEATPLGDLSSRQHLLVEIWGPVDGVTKGFVVVVPPGEVVWVQGHYGQSNWWTPADILEQRIAHSVNSITARDGVPPTVVDLPEEGFLLLGCLQAKPVTDGTRFCEPVGGVEGFTAPAQMPEPGLFQGYPGAKAGVVGETTSIAAQDGPAICEDGALGAAVKVNEGESYPYDPTNGTCWPLSDQAALDARWPEHLKDFQSKYPGASVYDSVAAVP